MAQEFYYPISGATHDLPAGYDDFTNAGGANKNASTLPGGGRAGPMTHDDATTYIAKTNSTFEQALNPDWPGPVGVISAITLGFRQLCGGTFVTRNLYFVNAAGTPGSYVLSQGDIVGYTTVGPADASGARPGGGSWGPSDVVDDKTMFLAVNTSAGTGTVNVTSIWGQLTYVPPSGGFVFLLGLAGLGALPFVGRLTDIAQFHSYLSWRRRFHPRHTILTGEEVQQAWAEIKAYKNPTFFLPAVA